MNIFTETKLINLNSKDAILNNSTYLSNVYFNYTGILKDEEDIVEKYISIQNAQIPFSFYNINVYNNILKIQISTTIYTLTLTQGNYNATSLITEITTQLTNNSITDITITISPITGILTFTKSSGSFSIISSGSTIYNVLGFVPGTNYNSVTQKIIAPYPLNLLGTLRLRICSFELATSNIDYTLITLPIEVGNFGLIQYTNISNIKSVLTNPSIDGFDILILDDNNNQVNFNNINWTMTILLTLVRKKQNISDLKFYDIIKAQYEKNQEIPDEEITPENEDVQNEVQNEEQQTEEITPENENALIPETDENNYIDDNIENEENVDYEMQEPERDDLDLLLYNNHGNLY
jgi:hypothetical protein